MSMSLAYSLITVAMTCGPPTPPQVAGPFKLSGEFTQHPNTPYRVSSDYVPGNPVDGATIANGETDSHGRFEVNLKLKKGQAFVLTCGRSLHRLWAEPGGHLGFVSSKGKVSLTGRSSKANLFLLNNGLATRTVEKNVAPTDLVAFKRKVDAETRRLLEGLDGLTSSARTSERFRLYAQAQIFGSGSNRKSNYPDALIAQGKLKKSDIPRDYYKFRESLPLLGDEAALLSRSYQSALGERFGSLAARRLESEGIDPVENPDRWALAGLRIQAAQLVNHPATNELLLADKIMFMNQYLLRSTTTATLKNLRKTHPTSKYLPELENAYSRTGSINLKAIDKAVSFQNSAGDRVSFGDLKGKIVYVDFWGQWCNGCVLQQPDYEKLAKDFAPHANIAFVAINFADEAESWKKFVTGKKSTYLQWKPASAEDEARAMTGFAVDAFPRYMLFGTRGELLSASAPIPGSQRIRHQLKELASAARRTGVGQ